jgi:hypothetical protein
MSRDTKWSLSVVGTMVALFLLIWLCGCAFLQPHQKDIKTIANFEKALAHRRSDFELARQMITHYAHPSPDEMAVFKRNLTELDALERAAEEHLKTSIWREHQKSE